MIYNLTDDIFISSGALAGKNPVKLRQYDNRLWAVCDDGSIVFSNNGNSATWDAANIILLPNRELALDFLPVQGGAIIPHRNGAYAFYGSGSYQDTSILPIQAAANDPVTLTDSAVVVSNVAYILSDRGVYAVSLNGMQELPHSQDSYFAANYGVWIAQNGAIQGVYLPRFHSILYLFHSSYGGQGFLFGLRTNAFQKVNQSLPPVLPYLTPLACQVDYLLGSGDGTVVCKSAYPSGPLLASRSADIQTRHEDANSLRDKVWRELIVTVADPVYCVTVSLYLDESGTPVVVSDSIDLAAGENRIPLFSGDGEVLRSRTVSVALKIEATPGIQQDDITGSYLRDEEGELLTDESVTLSFPANFTIKALSLRYREAGPQL